MSVKQLGNIIEQQERTGALELGWEKDCCRAHGQGTWGILGHGPWWPSWGARSCTAQEPGFIVQFRTWDCMAACKGWAGVGCSTGEEEPATKGESRAGQSAVLMLKDTWARQIEQVQWCCLCIFHSLKSSWMQWNFLSTVPQTMTHALVWNYCRKTNNWY